MITQSKVAEHEWLWEFDLLVSGTPDRPGWNDFVCRRCFVKEEELQQRVDLLRSHVFVHPRNGSLWVCGDTRVFSASTWLFEYELRVTMVRV